MAYWHYCATVTGSFRGTVVERWSLAGDLSVYCADE